MAYIMTNNIDNEIIRLTDLKQCLNADRQSKILKAKFLISMWGNAPDGEANEKRVADLKKGIDEKLVVCEDYYNATDKFLETKILFFTYYKQNAFPEKFIDRMNEDFAEHTTCSWAYFGMAEHEKERDQAMEEFDFFKQIINSTPVIKKRTRRSGKKHRK